MYELKVTVKKVLGACTAHPPMKPGDHFTVRDGDIRIPDGGFICMWALQNLMPLLPAKERALAEKKDQDWMWRVRHAQCPDPDGRVLFEIEQTGKIDKKAENVQADQSEPLKTDDIDPGPPIDSGPPIDPGPPDASLKTLRIEVDSVNGRCTSTMKPGDYFLLRSGRIYIPPGRPFCLYALQAVLPLLPAKQRMLQDNDWMKDADRIVCPDPAGNVILRIHPME